jgi:hypothetical protein
VLVLFNYQDDALPPAVWHSVLHQRKRIVMGGLSMPNKMKKLSKRLKKLAKNPQKMSKKMKKVLA